MENHAPEPHTIRAQAEEAKAQEPAKDFADIVIFCHPRNVGNLVQSFENEITHAAGALPMFVLWSGVSGMLHQGVIVLEWEGTVSPAFLQNLSVDHELFDFVVYDWTRSGDHENTQPSEQNRERFEIQP